MNRYAVADLHGQLDLLLQIKEYINDDDILYILGDSGDRGPEPWQTLKASLDDPRFIYLMGNHDLMLIKAIEQYNKIPEEDKISRLHLYTYGREPIAILALNGGMGTLEGWAAEPNRMYYYQRLRFAPLEVRLAALDGEHFIYLTHAGYTPNWCEPLKVEEFVWDRNHIHDAANTNGSLIIYGHTPVTEVVRWLRPYGAQYHIDKECLYHAEDTKINIDIGACFYNKTVLLNIDTLEEIVFTTKEEDVDGAQGK